jgi:hypothetical protein
VKFENIIRRRLSTQPTSRKGKNNVNTYTVIADGLYVTNEYEGNDIYKAYSVFIEAITNYSLCNVYLYENDTIIQEKSV